MKSIIYGCFVTNKITSGNYRYYLYSRIDNYALIMREKITDDEWLVRIIRPEENIVTVWAAATSQTYVRPDALSTSDKRIVVNKMRQFLGANKNFINNF